MTAFLRSSSLSSGGLSLSLNNDLGQPQDAESVVWTISSAHSGRRLSGLRMKAVRCAVGRYYAPWYADDPTGACEILWEYRRDAASPTEIKVERFFVTDLEDPVKQDGHMRGLPPPGGHVFEPGKRISGSDLMLRLTGTNGSPVDVHGVQWRVECHFGNAITSWNPAVRLSAGVYGASWTVNLSGGKYFIRWQWAEAPGLPLEEVVDTFQVVDPRDPKSGVESVGI